MSGRSPSIIDDIVGAFASVGRTLLAVVVAVVGLFLGAIVLMAGALAWLVFWVAWKLRLTKIPPKARFQRIQLWLVGKYVQRKLKKAGMAGPGGSPFGGAAGQPDMSQMCQGPMADMFAQMQKDAERVRQDRAAGKRPGQSRADAAEPSQHDLATSADEADDAPEVRAEEVGEYQGSVEELLRRRRG